MITEQVLKELAPESACAWSELERAGHFLNESGSAKAASPDVLRIICCYAAESRVTPMDFILEHQLYLEERRRLYQLKLDHGLASGEVMAPALRDLETVTAAFADVDRTRVPQEQWAEIAGGLP
jgi:hypothetical protein